MTHKKKLRLNRFLLILTAILLSGLTACSVVGDLIGGGEEPPPPPPPPEEEPPVAEALPEVEVDEPTVVPPTPTPMPTATPVLVEEELVVPEADKESEEPTPTPVAQAEETVVEVTPLGGEAEPEPEEVTPEATAEVEPTLEGEATPEEPTELETTPEIEGTPEPTTTTVTPTVSTYTVKAGDTLGEIAQANNTTVAEIVGLNQGTYPSLKTNPDKIEVGWVLKLAPSGETYTVRQADTLDEIATEFGTTIEMLISLNEDSYPSLRTDPGKLEIGWVLVVP